MGNPYAQYQNNSVMTASPVELTLMLYNGSIKFCNQAIEAIQKKDMANSHKYIVKAEQIIEELRVTLDLKYPIAEEMDRLYEYIYQLLVEANMEKDVQKLQEAAGLIREFRDAWQQVMKVRKQA